MHQNFSFPTLSPLPPYPSNHSPPATAPPSPELLPSEPPAEPVEENDSMRATHVHPRAAPASPDRPGTAYSTRSTIRQVEPSPDSLNDAFTSGFADSSTPAPGTSFEPFPPFNPSGPGYVTAGDDSYTHIHSTEPTAGSESDAGALRRGGTPSGRTSPRKSRSCSPQKSRSQSPRKHMVRTPTLPMHQESPSSAYSAADSERWEAPDTPSPVSREQQRQVYAPLKVHRPVAPSNDADEPAVGQGNHAWIADYMRRQQRGEIAKAKEVVREGAQKPGIVKEAAVPVPHIVQAMAHPPVASQTISPFSAAQIAVQRQTQQSQEPARHISVSRRSEASGASVASKHSIFSTPGRDEMERKKPIVEEDEGPFSRATNKQDLEQRRRTVSEGNRNVEGNDERKFCGMRCLVM